MILLTTASHPTIMRWRHPHLGRLVVPKDCARVAETAAAGVPWAADNGAYGGLDLPLWSAMLERVRGVAGCLFAVVPDCVGDHEATLELWREHAPAVRRADLPPAFVLQEGVRGPWDVPSGARALFIGGREDAFKASAEVQVIVTYGRERGLWVHMGRVNTDRRVLLAQSIGCQSFDGSSTSVWRDTHLPGRLVGAAAAAQGRQMRLGE